MRHRGFLQWASIAVLTLSLSFVSVIPVALSNHEALPDVTIRIAVPPQTSLENVVQIRITDPSPDSIFALSQNGSTALGYRDSWNQSYANGFLSAKRVEAYTGPRIIGAGSSGSGALPTFMGFVVSASLLLLIGLILHGVLVQQSQVRQRCYTAICILERTLSSNRIELRILHTAFRVVLFICGVGFLLWLTSVPVA